MLGSEAETEAMAGRGKGKKINRGRRTKKELADWPLVARPGFLVRRLHQIHVSLFMEVCAAFKITPLQYSVLSVLSASGTTDQTTLASAVALDRTTTTGIVKRLQARGLIKRTTSDKDRRAQACSLSSAGKALLLQMEGFARQAHHDTLAPLDRDERTRFMRLLTRLIAAHADRPRDRDFSFLNKT